jgi:hypothetical protein
VFPRDILCFRNISINTLHKGDDDDDDDHDDDDKEHYFSATQSKDIKDYITGSVSHFTDCPFPKKKKKKKTRNNANHRRYDYRQVSRSGGSKYLDCHVELYSIAFLKPGSPKSNMCTQKFIAYPLNF